MTDQQQITFTLKLPGIQIFLIVYAIIIISLHIYLLSDMSRVATTKFSTLYAEIAVFILSILLFIGALVWFITYRKKVRDDAKNDNEASMEKVWVISDLTPTTMGTGTRSANATSTGHNTNVGDGNNTNTASTLNQNNNDNSTYLPFMEHEVDDDGIKRIRSKN
ncbi:hypothetical protein CONCODRAFT_11632 [Conidiobolus coronatus NRRL 28638]|uniref:Uncharacterized protein n=1 Tax=Conidiobolus coronatus (strain ATCC 28846 / CBS 209.66 / NRRL 28638) TaxID=796925 RepID=A0A137NUU7_CONC2|nr:hypothetical protein CONCODRAFT_11632 [Conidiobolus coronatus NRRL 28638]|eukprot:KXN66502.1 hypothetical protein CONCODRAFT_11632 [Conidiobolus coronatus NRRL 28638]